MSKSSEQLSRLYVATMRGWDGYEERTNSGLYVIDSDVADGEIEPIYFGNRDEVSDSFRAIEDHIDPYNLQTRNLGRQITAMQTVLVEATRPESIEYPDLITKTHGTSLEVASGVDILRQNRLINQELEIIRPGFRLSAENKDEYEKLAVVVHGRDEIEDTFRRALDWSGHVLEDKLGIKLDVETVEVIFVEENGPGVAQVITNEEHEPVLMVNVHNRVIHSEGFDAMLALHEGGHVIYYRSKKLAIRNKKLPQSDGIQTPYEPRVVADERFSHTMVQTSLVDEPGSFGRLLNLAAHLDAKAVMVAHKMHILLNTGTPTERAAAYAIKRRSFDKASSIRKSAIDRTRQSGLTFNIVCAADWPALKPIIEGGIRYASPLVQRGYVAKQLEFQEM